LSTFRDSIARFNQHLLETGAYELIIIDDEYVGDEGYEFGKVFGTWR
jgi:hypothetical protein